MKNLLQINSSIFSAGGQSSQLAERFVAAWREANPAAAVNVRDLAREPIPHLDAARFAAFIAKPEERNPDQQGIAKDSDALIAELKAADVLVLGLPLYNLGLPSTLKAYFDHVGRVGHTFKYTEKGPIGLLSGKKAYVFAARGGLYEGTPLDTQTGYVRDFLGFMGITDVEFIYAEGLAISEEIKNTNLARAHQKIGDITVHEAIAI
jgi:FMN-dependent NADH-azoreductase